MKKGYTSLEICTGAGGQALGLELAGFRHMALVEFEEQYCECLKVNKPDWNVICKDVRDFSGIPYRGKIDLLILQARNRYHKRLLDEGVLSVDKDGIPSNADKSSRLSIAIARDVASQLEAHVQTKALGQTSGARFESINMLFLEETFPNLQHLRPGQWKVAKLGNRNSIKTSSFAQYEHLDYLATLTLEDPKLAASLGNDYMVAPDVVIYREPETDEFIILHCRNLSMLSIPLNRRKTQKKCLIFLLKGSASKTYQICH